MAKVNSESAVALPLQIKEGIRDRILSDRLKPDDKLPSENNLAEECGVSRMTARQALVELISEGALYRVPGKGTFVSGSPTSKETKNLATSLIMLIVPNLCHSFFHQIISGIERTTSRNNHEILLRSVNEDALEERKCLQKVLEGGVKGLILIAGKYSHTNLNIFQKIKQRIPIVILDVAVSGLETDLVISDDREGGFLITEHLIELGHKKILHLAGPKGDSSAEERFAGYKEALKKYQIEFQPELVRFTEWHSEEGYYETKKFFLNGAIKEKVTAIFAGNDEAATGAFKALTELKLKVPEEIGLAGYGNLEIGQLLEIPLTTVNQSAVEMGKVASQLLLDKLAGVRNFEERKDVRVPTKLVIRQSCGIQGNDNIRMS